MRLSRRKIYGGGLVFWVGLTIVLTSIPNPPVVVDIRGIDKVVHFGFYGVTGFLCALWRREAGQRRATATLWGFAFAALVGAVDELHQDWIPGRSADVLDWLADAAGGGIGAFAAAVLPSLFPFLVNE